MAIVGQCLDHLSRTGSMVGHLFGNVWIIFEHAPKHIENVWTIWIKINVSYSVASPRLRNRRFLQPYREATSRWSSFGAKNQARRMGVGWSSTVQRYTRGEQSSWRRPTSRQSNEADGGVVLESGRPRAGWCDGAESGASKPVCVSWPVTKEAYNIIIF